MKLMILQHLPRLTLLLPSATTYTTTGSTTSSSLRECDSYRDTAKRHLLSDPFQSKTKVPTVSNRQFRAGWSTAYLRLE